MTSVICFFVESEGILLPDGSVFGAGVSHEYDVMKGENVVNLFTIYQYIGKKRVSITGNENWSYKQMREWVHEQARHYTSCGMRFWSTDRSDWNKAKEKILVDENW